MDIDQKRSGTCSSMAESDNQFLVLGVCLSALGRLGTFPDSSWEAVRVCAVEIAAKVRPVVVAVLKEVQEATVELYGFVVAAFRAIKQWLACKEQASQEHDEQARRFL